MKSIKTKLIVYFSILILVSSITLGFVAIQKASISLTKEAEKSLISLSVDASKLTESRIETQKRTLEMIAQREVIETMDWKKQQPILQNQVERTNFLDIAVVQPDGTAYYSDGTVSQLGDKEYVKKAFNGETNISDLLIDRITNDISLMYATPIKREGEIVGVLIGRRDGNTLSMIADDTGYGNKGYGYIIDSNATVIGHPNRQMVLDQFNPIEEAKKDDSLIYLGKLFEKIITEKEGLDSYSFGGNDLYAGYAPIEGSDWIFVITANQDEVLSAIPLLQRTILITLVIVLIVSIVIVFLIGNSITNPIIATIRLSEKISNLDITEDVDEKYLKKKDEVGALGKALQNIINSLREIIQEINNSSQQVAASSEELTATSQQSATAAEEVSKTVEEIAKGASNQARNTDEGSTKAILLGEIIEKDQGYIKNLNRASNKVNEVVGEGLVEIDKLTKITKESSRATKEIYEVILKTNESSDKIGQASNVIASIAEQTNLLALNAAIEAARAGDAGRGFTVVSEEIRKLAEQSSASTKAIDEIVNELQNNVQEAVKTMERVSAISEDQTNSVISNKNKYTFIAEAMKEAEKAVEQLNASGEEMEKAKNEILDILQRLSTIAEENSAATQQASASMEEQTASVEEIAGASENLSNLAQKLQSIIMKFKI